MPKVDLENVEEAFAYAAEIREHAPSLFERLETARPEDALEMLTYAEQLQKATTYLSCLLYTSPSPRDPKTSRMPSSA